MMNISIRNYAKETLKVLQKKSLLHYSSAVSNTSDATTIPQIPHIPVLCEEAISFLDISSSKIFIDMTFGAGGHSRSILKRCDNVTIFALDRDPVAYEHAKSVSAEFPGHIIPLLGKFSDLPKLLKEYGISHNSVDGILFDFGCSSMQFDTPDRGFSVSKNGPLDMRMDRGANIDQLTAADVLSKIDEWDLVKILRVYGEEKAAKKIAQRIIEARTAFFKLERTKQLADLVSSCFSETHRLDKLQRSAHLATKTFQALRIFINNELNEINYGMILANNYLKINGRLVAITFHSLEDTIVKRHINGNVIQGRANTIPLRYSGFDVMYDKELVESLVNSNWKQLHKHVILPGDDEIANNSRSRSAKLRAAVKVK